MSVGKSIRLFLADGTPGGLLTAEIMNWTGHVIAAPRSDLAGLMKRPETSRTGVYLLLGDDPDSLGGQLAYIYIEQAKIVLPVLGVNLFRSAVTSKSASSPPTTQPISPRSESPVFQLHLKRKASSHRPASLTANSRCLKTRRLGGPGSVPTTTATKRSEKNCSW